MHVIRKSFGSLAGRHLRRLSNVDISSPVNMMLDVESPGRDVRETSFSLYPKESLERLIVQFNEENRGPDLVANLVHRAMEILEESDSQQREESRRKFQSEIYAVHAKMFREMQGCGFGIFEMYNRQRFAEIAPKLKGAKLELVRKLITQPLLRIVSLNRDITLDPNQVMKKSGVDGFRAIMDLFNIDLRLLNAHNLNRLLSALPPDQLVEVWFQVWDESIGVGKPVKKGSQWTMEKVLLEIIRKQSRDVFFKLFLQVGGTNSVKELIAVCRKRHTVTGTPKHPWANDLIDSLILQREIDSSVFLEPSFSGGHDQSLVSLARGDEPIIETPSDKQTLISQEHIFLINSDAQLTRVKECLKDRHMVSLSFPANNVLAIAANENAFVIDLTAVKIAFVKYLVTSLLNDTSRRKVVYSLESFLDRMQSDLKFSEGIVHFENLIDLRKGRIRRSLTHVVAEPELEEDHNIMISQSVELPVCEKKSKVAEKTEHFYQKTPLPLMAEEMLGYHHNRSLVFQPNVWLYRPLPVDVIEFAAHDAHVLLRLEKAFRAQNMMPVEILNYDPF